jgi:lipopolysaccharide transport system permease protein
MSAPTELIIEAGRTERHYWRDLWKYRELFAFLAWRDVAVRYKQTAVGLLWALLRPLLTTAVLTVTFSRIAHVAAPEGVPYVMIVLAGMLPWTLFSGAFSGGSASLVGNSALISKVYFPRLILPVSAVVVGFVEFAVSLVLLAALMVWYQVPATPRLLTLPLFTFVAVVAAAGPAIWIGALNVRYRDFTQVVPFLLLLGGYLSPVAYTTDHVFANDRMPALWKFLYALNPMVGVIDGFRWAILGGAFHLDARPFLLSLLMTVVLLAGGIAYFRRTEKTFADVI